MKPPCGKNCAGRTTICRKSCPKWAEYEAWKGEEENRKRKRFLYRDAFYACKYTTMKRRRQVWAQV